MFSRGFLAMFSSGATSTDLTLWEQLWQYLDERYFSVDLGRYKNLNFGTGSLLSVASVIFGIYLGIVIAAGFACYDKNKLGGFVRKIVRSDCLSADRAKTLEELEYDGRKGWGVRGSLKYGSVLKKVVRCVERDTHEAEEAAARAAYIEEHGTDKGFEFPRFVLDFDLAHFYIPDEEHYAAEVRFERDKGGWRSFLLVVIIGSVCVGLTFFFLPELLQMLDNMVGLLKGDGNVVN